MSIIDPFPADMGTPKRIEINQRTNTKAVEARPTFLQALRPGVIQV